MADMCYSCDGVGVDPDMLVECPYCQGTGWLTDERIAEMESENWEPEEEPKPLVENIFELMFNEWFHEREFNELLQTFDLKHVDLSGHDLAWLDFSDCDLRRANFSGCDLSQNQFANADIRDATFDGAVMSGTLDGARVAGASFRHAVFEFADISTLDFGGSEDQPPSFHGVKLHSADLTGLTLGKANLEAADLSSADLSDASLKSANLDNARLIEATLTGTDLESASLRSADLTSADLSRANLRRSNLSEARFEGANLREADLRGATLLGSSITSAESVSAAQLDTSTVLDERQRRFLRNAGAIVESPRDTARIGIDWTDLKSALRGADLREADLRHARLQRSDLSNADLRGADLTSASLDQANLRGALLSGARLVQARLQDAVLVEAKLDHADLSRADMAGAVLKNADLANVNLQGTVLTGSDVSGANLLAASQIDGANVTSILGLTEEELDVCVSQGAVVTPPSEQVPEPDTRRYKRSGKARGMALAYSSARRKKLREKLDLHVSPDQQDAIQKLSNALDLEAFLGRENGLNKRYMSEYEEVAKSIMAWLNDAGYEIVVPSKSGDDDGVQTANERSPTDE